MNPTPVGSGPRSAKPKTAARPSAAIAKPRSRPIVSAESAAPKPGSKSPVKASAKSSVTASSKSVKPAVKAVPTRLVKPNAKQVPGKKLVAKQVAAKQVAPKQVVAKPVAVKQVVAKQVAVKQVAAKRVVLKQVPGKKLVAKPVVVKQVAAKPVVAKPVVAKPIPAKGVAATQLPNPKHGHAAKFAPAPKPSRPASTSAFAALGIPEDVLVALDAQGITTPFPIQELTIRDGLAGRDVCGQAKTGSGKTLAFGIPLVSRLTHRAAPRKPLALILVPTRELAAQVEREMIWLAKPGGYSVVSVYGGVSMDDQRTKLLKGAEIVVATPGRLIDLLGRGDIDLGALEFLVIDEADRMCDMGFMPNVEWILRKMPRHRQTLLFSATLGSDVNSLIRHELRDPVRHVVESTTTTVDSSVHHFLQVHQMDKSKVVAAILRSNDRSIVFLNTKRACDRLSDELKDLGLNVRAIHGDLSQDQRNRALRQFTGGQITALIATDVAARGLHIDGVDVVVQADIPDDHKTYLHRSGRTARAGAAGVVVTLAMWNQLLEVERLQKRLGMSTKPVEMFSNDQRLTALGDWQP